MIFYFTGTGNSLAAAKALAEEGEQIISIAEVNKTKAYSYTFKRRERLGIVFPEYCSTVGKPVLDFVRNLDVKGQPYCFAVITCGGVVSFAARHPAALCNLCPDAEQCDHLFACTFGGQAAGAVPESRCALCRTQGEAEKVSGASGTRRTARDGVSAAAAEIQLNGAVPCGGKLHRLRALCEAMSGGGDPYGERQAGLDQGDLRDVHSLPEPLPRGRGRIRRKVCRQSALRTSGSALILR